MISRDEYLSLWRTLSEVKSSQERLEKMLATSMQDSALPHSWYGTDEAAALLKRTPHTVREWCRLGRLNARKRAGGRGRKSEWEISREELIRFKNHGLLPCLHVEAGLP